MIGYLSTIPGDNLQGDMSYYVPGQLTQTTENWLVKLDKPLLTWRLPPW